jgi:hypothetical protein
MSSKLKARISEVKAKSGNSEVKTVADSSILIFLPSHLLIFYLSMSYQLLCTLLSDLKF